MHISKEIEWNADKAEILLRERNINMNEIADKIRAGQFKIVPVDNQMTHPGQRMFLVELNDYIHCVPFVEDNLCVFLKTAFRSRKHQKESV